MNDLDNSYDRCPNVLVFSGHDPSGGSGLVADIGTIQAVGAHPLPIITAPLIQQQGDHVFVLRTSSAATVRQQAEALIEDMTIDAVKVGILGTVENAEVAVEILYSLRAKNPNLPIVLDPILLHGHEQRLEPESVWKEFYPLISVLTPTTAEANYLCGAHLTPAEQAQYLMDQGVDHVLFSESRITTASNHIQGVAYDKSGAAQQWRWPRTDGDFSGSGCTLASAIAAHLSLGFSESQSLGMAQEYCQKTFEQAFSIKKGFHIPNRLAF